MEFGKAKNDQKLGFLKSDQVPLLTTFLTCMLKKLSKKDIFGPFWGSEMTATNGAIFAVYGSILGDILTWRGFASYIFTTIFKSI